MAVQDVTTNELRRIFGENVRKYRHRRKWSQDAFAEKLGVHKPYVSEIENGHRSVLFETIAKIADELGTTPDALLRRSNSR